jgi:hypothetical protein
MLPDRHRNKLGANFNKTICGYPAGPTNDVIAKQHFNMHSSSVTMFAQEKHTGFFTET